MNEPPRSPRRDEPDDPLNLRATPWRLTLVGRAAGLPQPAIRRAIDIATRTPSPAEWRRYLSAMLALFGTMLLLAGAIMFVAYNWERIGRFGKFGLLEAGIVATVLLAWRKLPKLSGQIALFAACVLVGPLLALYGQTYQTGADPYGLFLTWSLLILPWALAGRFGAIWILVLLLLDVAIGLYFMQVLSPRTTAQALVLPLLVALLHAVAALLWELQLRRDVPLIPERWALRVIAVVGFIALFVPAAYFIAEGGDAGLPGLVAAVALAVAVVGTMRYYRNARIDRFMWTLAGVAGMGAVTVVVARIVFGVLDLGAAGLFVMAAFVVWQITWGVKVFRRSRAA